MTARAVSAPTALERRVTEAVHGTTPGHDPVQAVLALLTEVSAETRTEAYAVERQAAVLCGPETYLRGGVHRPYWRRRARKHLAAS